VRELDRVFEHPLLDALDLGAPVPDGAGDVEQFAEFGLLHADAGSFDLDGVDNLAESSVQS
jgi:hypothetical protein